MADEIINKDIIEGGSPVGDPSLKEKDNGEQNTPQNTEDELTKKIKEILAEQFKDISELQNKSDELEQEKYKMQVEKLLGDSKVLDGRFFDFIYTDDIELVKTRIENLENLIIEKANEIVDSRLGATSWIPGNNSNIEGIDTFKKPSYMI